MGFLPSTVVVEQNSGMSPVVCRMCGGTIQKNLFALVEGVLFDNHSLEKQNPNFFHELHSLKNSSDLRIAPPNLIDFQFHKKSITNFTKLP